MKRTLSHAEVQNLVYELAKEVVKICDKHDIKYFIEAGTLLGAIRHEDFIPWDDDIDFAMLGKDYEKFIKVCQLELDRDKFFLQTADTDSNYAFNFAKIRLKNTYISEEFSEGVNQVSNGIFVDIFPFWNITDSGISKKMYSIANKYFNNLVWIKLGYGTKKQKKSWMYKVLKIVSHLYKINYLRDKQQKLIKKYSMKNTLNVVSTDYIDDVLDRKFFSEGGYFKFRNIKLFGFKNYHTYLVGEYGENYMDIPPKDKQEIHIKEAYILSEE